MSLRARMGLAAGAAVAVAVIAVVVSAYLGTRTELLSQKDNQLKDLARPVLASACQPASGGGGPPSSGGGDHDSSGSSGAVGGSGSSGNSGSYSGYGGQGPACQSWTSSDPDEGLRINHPGQAFGGPAGTITLLRKDGSSVQPSGQQYRIPADSRAKAVAASGRGQYFTDMTVQNNHIRVMVTGLGARGALMIALPLSDVDSSLSNELLLLAIVGAAGIALAALLGILVARTALAPIARFTRQTERIAEQPELIESERLQEQGGDELSRLARTFNNTLDALQQSVEAQRSLVADASHELRTPIASIRANIQLMRDEALLPAADREALRADVIDELDELTKLVSDVVELARGNKRSESVGDVRLDAVVGELVERTRRRAPGLTVTAQLEPTLVRGEAERIARAASNLLDNAVKWSPEGGVIEVELRAAVLTVRDHGPGFHEQDLPFVFDRFHRARDARGKPGSGLGLAIVRQAAESQGGFVEAANAPDGGALMRIGFGPALELDQVESEFQLGAS